MMSAMDGSQWQSCFQKTKGKMTQAQHKLQQWERLGDSSAYASDRARIGTEVRTNIKEVKQEFQQLERQLGTILQEGTTQKSITQWRDEVQAELEEVARMDERSKVSRGGGNLGNLPRGNSNASLPSSSFTKMEEGGMTNRQIYEQQQAQMQVIEDRHLPMLENQISNLRAVSRDISGEVTTQNRMLDHANSSADRLSSRMNSVNALMSRVIGEDRNRILGCIVVVLFMILVFIIVKMIID
jgi:hypothetical protein